MEIEYIGPNKPEVYNQIEYIGPKQPEDYIDIGKQIKSELGLLFSRGKELLINQPARTMSRGIEQLQTGQPFRGIGNILLAPLETLSGAQKFIFGDPATKVAQALGFGETTQEITSTVSEIAGGLGISGMAMKVPSLTSRIAAETIGFGKPQAAKEKIAQSLKETTLPAAEGTRIKLPEENTLADSLKSSDISLTDKKAMLGNIIPSVENKIDLSQSLTSPILKQSISEKIETTAEAFFMQAKVVRNPKQLLSDQITELLSSEKLTIPEINNILTANNTTFKELATELFRPSVRDAAERLGRLGRLSQRIDSFLAQYPELQKDMGAIIQAGRDIDESIRGRNWWQRATGIWRGTLVTQLATSMRNVETQFGRLGLNVLENLMDSGLQKIFGTINRTKPIESIEPIIRLFAKGTKTEVETILKEFPKEHDRLFGYFASDIATKVGEGAGGKIDEIFTAAEKGVSILNTINRWQEFTFRRAIFAAEYARTNDVRGAVNKALELTWAKNPEYGSTAQNFISVINNTPAALAVPFARFTVNALKFFYEFSPMGLLKLLNSTERTKIAAGDFQTITRATLGSAMLGAAWQFRNSEYAGEKWYEAKIGNKEIDIRPFNPFAAYLFVADFIKRAEEGTLGRLSTKDWVEAIASINLRTGTGLSILDNLFSQWKGGDPEKWVEQAKRTTGEFIGGFGMPLQMIKDVLDGFSESAVRDVTGSPIIGPLQRRIPGLESQLPEAYSVTQERPLMRQAPLLRQLTGISIIQSKNPAQQTLDRLGFKQQDVFLPTGDPKADRTMKQTTGLLVERVLSPIVSTEQFKSQSPTLQAVVIQRILSRIKTHALNNTLEQYPDVAVQVKLGKIPNRLKLFLEKETGLDIYNLNLQP